LISIDLVVQDTLGEVLLSERLSLTFPSPEIRTMKMMMP